MLSLWKSAIEANKALLLEEFNLGPDALLEKVEEFEGISHATEHSYPAFTSSSENAFETSVVYLEDGTEDNYSSDGIEDVDDYDSNNDDDDYYSDDEDDEFNDIVDTSAQPGSLPIDLLVNKLKFRKNN
jgi:hypothetical protein